MIPFKMMCNMSLLCHRFPNERWGGGGGGGGLNHLPLLFCKSVYFVKSRFGKSSRYFENLDFTKYVLFYEKLIYKKLVLGRPNRKETFSTQATETKNF